MLIKMSLSIEMIEVDNDDKTDLCIYQRPIEKLIYLLYAKKSDIIFIIK